MRAFAHGIVEQRVNCDLIIFGGTGDLARRSLIPALHSMYGRGELGKSSRVISASRRSFSDEEYRQQIMPQIPPKDWESFSQCLFHRPVDIAGSQGFSSLYQMLAKSQASQRLLYLSTLPEHFVSAVRGAYEAGLVTKQTLVIVEKPVGTDLNSARILNNQLSEIFDESQILRIDHYLGKQRVRALAGRDFGQQSKGTPVQITLAESQHIGTRGEFYDRTGALRDMVQNHLLQLLCLVAADPAAEDLNAAKLEVLEALHSASEPVWGQFDGYLEVPGVAQTSHTETFFAMRTILDLDPWHDTPFLLRTGKSLRRKLSQVMVGGESIDLAQPGENAYEALLGDALRGDRGKFVSREEVEAAWRFIDQLRTERTPAPPLPYACGSWGPAQSDVLANCTGDAWDNGESLSDASLQSDLLPSEHQQNQQERHDNP